MIRQDIFALVQARNTVLARSQEDDLGHGISPPPPIVDLYFSGFTAAARRR
jgi:hypothetical protein